ncbi:hypothetical protein KDX16_07850 [Burkholderia vietnamiensis]|uniref:hypothetical protein n=1 Tax=Burkholderia vietnamiensis TaxID=60552 RepID=UPI0012D8620A|nr:hypothetical protein [Burkholderia vietnamiensis]MBR7915754.1 hypothetical protein [Burkholderia vietnamiensis]
MEVDWLNKKAAVVALRNASIAVTAATTDQRSSLPAPARPARPASLPPGILLLKLLQPGRQNGSRFEVANPASVKPQRIA